MENKLIYFRKKLVMFSSCVEMQGWVSFCSSHCCWWSRSGC